jgi:putative ABC transport system permease protein
MTLNMQKLRHGLKNVLQLLTKDSKDPTVLHTDQGSVYASIAYNELIKEYNKGVPEEKQIKYTDMVALLMSGITTIVNAITYVLIAFVGISLVVSSIMIGIITYISVLERTKEIGILRAIGASKKDIRRVFNAETLIIGFVSGMIGILATLFLNIIINIILFQLTEIAALKAVLPVAGAIILVLVSMFLTFIAGLFPSGVAAKRNPVEALRSE